MKPILFILFLFSIQLNAQTYYAKYKGQQRTYYSMRDTSTGNLEHDTWLALLGNGVIDVNYDLHVIANNSCAYVMFVPTKIKSDMVKLSLKDYEYYVLDYKKKMLFDLNKKTQTPYNLSCQKPGPYNKIDQLLEQLYVNTKSGGADSATVVFDPAIPKALTGYYLFDNAPYGMKSAKTKNSYLVFSELRDTTDATLNTKIQEARKTCLKKQKPKNLLFR